MKHRSNTHPTVKYSQMNSVPKLFSCSYADCWTEKHFSTEFGVLTPNYTHSHTLFWGCVSRWFGRALAWHARGHRFDPGILHQKALYFVGSMVLFFLLKPIFWGLHCFACTVFRLLQAVPIQPPTFDFTPFSKRNVCRPFLQQAAASSPSIDAAKGGGFPQ